MRPTFTLLANATRITLFTRSGCSLCTTAKDTLQSLQTKRPFDYAEVNVMQEGQKRWKDMYEFDVPVVSTCLCCGFDAMGQQPTLPTLQLNLHMPGKIHVEKAAGPQDEKVLSAQKLMHRFSNAEVQTVMDVVEKS